MRQIFYAVLFSLTILTFAGCGGGSNVTPSTTYTTATVKINLNGDLGGKAIAGAEFTITLPANVTPAMLGGVAAVTPSGTFAGGGQLPPVYTQATETAPGTVLMVLTNSVPAGVTTAGEVATVTLQLANGAVPAAADFKFDTVPVKVIDTFGNQILGMTVTVGGVALQ
jgi:hypothetical protein